MESNIQAPPIPKKVIWIGWILSVLPALMLLVSASVKFMQPPEVVKVFAHLGIDVRLLLGLGILELSCVVVYLIPRTSVLGAILVTGYLGGAICAYMRLGEAFFLPLIIGVLIWGGLFLRDTRLRALLPLRS